MGERKYESEEDRESEEEKRGRERAHYINYHLESGKGSVWGVLAKEKGRVVLMRSQ